MSINSRFKVLSYNIHKGFGLGNREFTLPAIKTALLSVAPDVVFLQEVVGQNDKHARRIERWPELPQCHYLAEGVWAHVAYGQTLTYDHGHQGNAILSRFPILSYENIDISTNPLESRALLHAVLDVPGLSQPVHCVCVHLSLFPKGREEQLKRICSRVVTSVGLTEPLIVAGDFNDWQQRASGILVRELAMREVFFDVHGSYAPTFPTQYPVFKLDRVYARGLSMVEGRALVGDPWGKLSDHAPLYAELIRG
ncbi:MAG: endonuclease/exonuclease/phosphatase family protein [Pseudomonadota bacterium]|jgi:endonuclease/exonuclease/phosphatase family metal-dependent hydrolase